MSPHRPRYFAVIPAYNESATIRAVAAHTLRRLTRVIIIDDGSTDGTAATVDGLPVTVLRHANNRGKAAALWLGMQQALADGADAVITLDGDGQHNPDDIPSLIRSAELDPRAIVIGARLRGRGTIPLLRALAQRTADYWVSRAAGRRITDSQSGLRLYPTSVLRTIGPQCDPTSGFAFESELLIEAGRRAIPIHTVPVSAVYGRHLRRSHFRQVRDVARITRMVTQKLLTEPLLNLHRLRDGYRRPPQPLHLPSASSLTWVHSASSRRPRLLFMAEAVSLAHVARAVALAQTLDPDRYDVHLACDPRYLSLFEHLPPTRHTIHSLSNDQFRERLHAGRPLYLADELREYVAEDLRVLAAINPDIAIGDFRLSLSVSARVAAVPYMTVTSAHWSPFAKPQMVVPELALTDRFGPRLGQILFSLMKPFVFAEHAAPLNRIRKEYGLAPIGHSLSRLFTEADVTLYADLPDLVPTFRRASTHHYLGPILWSPGTMPPWWDRLPADRPLAYVSLGTTGNHDHLPLILQALENIGMGALVSTAGGSAPDIVSPHILTASLLPGLQAATRARFVICNGGSATVYQGLAGGAPVLGLPGNLDQFLMMGYVRRSGAGDYLRAEDVSLTSLMRMFDRLRRDSTMHHRAARLAAQIRVEDSGARFQAMVASCLGAAGKAQTYSPAFHTVSAQASDNAR